MYIRRKAFSVAIDENGEERLFSTTEIMNEESYLEKLYAEAEQKKSHVGKKVAIGTGAAIGTTAAGIYGAKKLGDHIVKKAVQDLINDKIEKGEQYEKRVKTGIALQKPADKVEEVSKKVAKDAEQLSKAAKEKIKGGVNKAEQLSKVAREKLKKGETVKKILRKVTRKG